MRSKFLRVLTIEVLLGLALRTWLAFRVFRAQGFAWDLSTFADWMQTIRDNGHSAFAADPSINYPPVFAQLLQWVNGIGGHLACCNDPSIGNGPWLLLKWLPISADVGIALLLAYAGKRWYSERTALWASGLYLFIPVTWYDSAIWGQMDSVAALPMLAAVVLIAAKQPEWSAVLLVAGLLTKPQSVLALLVFVPVIIGQVWQGVLQRRRLLTAFASALVAFAALVNTWSLSGYVDSGVAGIPVIGNLVGLAKQYFSTADLFPYMSVNAYNPWALLGSPTMASQFETREVPWTTDNYIVLGMTAHRWGLLLFCALCLAVAFVLLRRPYPRTIFLALAVDLVGFFLLTTRVHERYLVQAFAVLALVWATTPIRRALVLAVAVANTANLHAVLVGGLRTVTRIIGEPPPAALYEHHGAPPELYGLSWPSLPALGVLDHRVVQAVICTLVAALVVLLADLLGSMRSRPRRSA